MVSVPFSGEKRRIAVRHLRRKSGKTAAQIPDNVIILETVKRYNGGALYTFKNGQFVEESSSYVDKVKAAKTAGGF